MEVGTITYNIGAEMSLDELISLGDESGLDGLELRTTHAHGVEPELDAAGRQAVREKFAATDVALYGLGSACEYHSPDPEELAKQIQLTRDFIDLAKDVGAVGVKIRPNALPEEVPVEKTLEQIGEALAQVGDYAAEKDVLLWLEMHGRGSSHPPHIKTMLDIADQPQVQACWNCNDADIADGSIHDYFGLLRDRIGLLHVHDLYDDYPYRELVELLKGIDYDGYVMAEIPGSDDPVRVMEYFAALWREMVR